MSAEDKVGNEFDQKKGEAKEWIGEHTDDPDLAEEGRGEQTDAHTRQATEHVKDAAHDAGDHLKDAAHDAGEHLKDAADDVREAFKRT